MSNNDDIKIGDRVRITYEGVVRGTAPSGAIRVENEWHYPEHNIKVIERAKPRVGAVIKTAAELLDLPLGSVVLNKHNRALTVLRSGQALGTDYGRVLTPPLPQHNAPYRLIHVGGGE